MERKVALITGGAKGIGRQIALSLAENGHDIAVNYHSDKNSADEICKTAKENGVNALSFYANMGNVDEIKNMVFQVDQKFGKIDVLINNAGISSEVYFLDATEEMFDQMTAIDWKGVYFCSQFVAKKMIEHQTKGVIVNLASNQVDAAGPVQQFMPPQKRQLPSLQKMPQWNLYPITSVWLPLHRGIRMLVGKRAILGLKRLKNYPCAVLQQRRKLQQVCFILYPMRRLI